MWENFPHRYLEETVLTVFLWIGLWGAVSLVVEDYMKVWSSKLIMYSIFAIVAFSLLYAREHIQSPK